MNPVDGEALLVRLDALAWRLREGVPVRGREIETLAADVERAAPGLPVESRARLLDGVRRVESAFSVATERMRTQRQTLAVGRRAGRAYLGGAR